VRSPGRVNLIGEHTDYNGYDVFPMAIDQDILFLVKVTNDHIVQLINKETQEFSPAQINLHNETDVTIKIENKKLHWSVYFLAAFHGIRKKYNINEWKGMRILVYGTLPKGSGLSSSSAFVCGSAIALLYANLETIFPSIKAKEVAQICIECERLVGINSGGMDQTICMLAEKGYAKHIEFVPNLRTYNVHLPDNNIYCWVIANCLVSHTLHDNTGTRNYNTRVVECRLAAILLGKYLGLENWKSIKTLRDVQDQTKLSLQDLSFKTMDLLKADPYNIEDIEEEIECNVEECLSSFHSSQKIIENIRKNKYPLFLQLRALHVYSEGLRVLQFKSLCHQYYQEKNAEKRSEIVTTIGDLMNKSHESCRDKYDCSSQELDALQTACLQGGALGSRLTGAGWGGCVVSLVRNDKYQEFKKFVHNHYYANIQRVPLDAIFSTQPSSSSCVIFL